MSSIYCSNCGKLIPRSSNFCKYCGAAQHGEVSARYRLKEPVQDNTQTQKERPAPTGGSRTKIAEYIKNCKHQRLCSQAKVLFFINYLVASSALLVLLFIGIYLMPSIFVPGTVVYFVVLYVIAHVVHRNFHYSLTDIGLEKEHGIIHKKSVTVPYNQIQNINVTRSMLDRILGISRLSIETAGRSDDDPRPIIGHQKTFAEADLPGLALSNAEELHDVLLEVAQSKQSV